MSEPDQIFQENSIIAEVDDEMQPTFRNGVGHPVNTSSLPSSMASRHRRRQRKQAGNNDNNYLDGAGSSYQNSTKRQSGFDYQSLGQRQKVEGYEKFDLIVQPKLYFMKDRMNTSLEKFKSNSPTISSQHKSSIESTSLRKFTDPNLAFQHRDRKLKVQKARQVLIGQAMDQSSRNYHLSKLQSNDYLHRSGEDHKQELQKKARLSIISMYQKPTQHQDSITSVMQTIDNNNRSHSVMEGNSKSPYLIEMISQNQQKRSELKHNQNSSKSLIRGNARITTKNLPPVQGATKANFSSLRNSITLKDKLPAINPSVVKSQRKRTQQTVSPNPFLDNYFLRPSRQSRFVEQTLRMSTTNQAKKIEKNNANQRQHSQIYNNNDMSMISISQQQEDSLMDESFLGKLGPNLNTIAPQKHDRYHSIELIKSTELNLIDNLNNQSADKVITTGQRNNLNNSSTLQEKQEEPMSKISRRDAMVDQGDHDLKLSLDSAGSNTQGNPLYMYKTVKASDSSRQRLAIIQKRFDFPLGNKNKQPQNDRMTTSQELTVGNYKNGMPPPMTTDNSIITISTSQALLPEQPPVTAYYDQADGQRNSIGTALNSSGGHSSQSMISQNDFRNPMSQVMHQSLRHRQKLIQEMHRTGSSSMKQRIKQEKEQAVNKGLIKGKKVILKQKQNKPSPLKQANQTQSQLRSIEKSKKHHPQSSDDDVLNRSIRVANLNSQEHHNSQADSRLETETVFGLHMQGSANGGNPYSMRSTLDKKSPKGFGLQTLTSADLIESGMILNMQGKSLLPQSKDSFGAPPKDQQPFTADAQESYNSQADLALKSKVLSEMPNSRGVALQKTHELDQIYEEEGKNPEEQFKQMSSELIEIMSAQPEPHLIEADNSKMTFDNLNTNNGDEMAGLNEYGEQQSVDSATLVPKKTLMAQSSHLKYRKLLSQELSSPQLPSPLPHGISQLNRDNESVDQVQTLPITSETQQIGQRAQGQDAISAGKSTRMADSFEHIREDNIIKMSPREISAPSEQDPYQIIQKQPKFVAMQENSPTKKKVIHLTQHNTTSNAQSNNDHHHGGVAMQRNRLVSDDSLNYLSQQTQKYSRQGMQTTEQSQTCQVSKRSVVINNDGSIQQVQTEQTDRNTQGESHRIVLKSHAYSSEDHKSHLALPSSVVRQHTPIEKMSVNESQQELKQNLDSTLQLIQPVQVSQNTRQSRYHSIDATEERNNYQTLFIQEHQSPKSKGNSSQQQHKVLISVRKSVDNISQSGQDSQKNESNLDLQDRSVPVRRHQPFKKPQWKENNYPQQVKTQTTQILPMINNQSQIKSQHQGVQANKGRKALPVHLRKPLNQKFKKVFGQGTIVDSNRQSFQSTLYDVRGVTMKLNQTFGIEQKESSQQTDFEDEYDDDDEKNTSKVSAYDEKAFPRRSTFMSNQKAQSQSVTTKIKIKNRGLLDRSHQQIISDDSQQLMNQQDGSKNEQQIVISVNPKGKQPRQQAHQNDIKLSNVKIQLSQMDHHRSRQSYSGLKLGQMSSKEIESGQIVIPERYEDPGTSGIGQRLSSNTQIAELTTTLKKGNPKLAHIRTNFGVRGWDHTQQSEDVNQDLMRQTQDPGTNLNTHQDANEHLGEATTPYQQSLVNLYSSKNNTDRQAADNEIRSIIAHGPSDIPRNRSSVDIIQSNSADSIILVENDHNAADSTKQIEASNKIGSDSESLRNPPRITSLVTQIANTDDKKQQSASKGHDKKQSHLHEISSSHDHVASIKEVAGNETVKRSSLLPSAPEVSSLHNTESVNNLLQSQVIMAEDRIHIYSKFEQSGVVMKRPIPIDIRNTDENNRESNKNMTTSTALNNFGSTNGMHQILSMDAGSNMGYIETDSSILMAFVQTKSQDKIKAVKAVQPGNLVYSGAKFNQAEHQAASKQVKDSSMSRYSMRQKSIMMVKKRVKDQIKRGF